MKQISDAVKILRAGGLVIFPTETVYGIGADANNQEACNDIYTVKGRPQNNPLIIHVWSIAMAEKICAFNESAYKLASSFWPGPMSLVLEMNAGNTIAKNILIHGQNKCCIRIPRHNVALALLKEFNGPIAAPSANISNYVSPTKKEHVSIFNKIYQLDGGRCDVGIESTIIDCTENRIKILRTGAIDTNSINKIAKINSQCIDERSYLTPGAMKKHYATKAGIFIDVPDGVYENFYVINFGTSKLIGKNSANLSIFGDLQEAALNLYDYLRIADNKVSLFRLSGICIARIPETGLGVAINDRLRRASYRDD